MSVSGAKVKTSLSPREPSSSLQRHPHRSDSVRLDGLSLIKRLGAILTVA